MGGKKIADRKEKVHTLKPEEKKTKFVEVVEEARAIKGKADELESPSVKQKIEPLNRILNENNQGLNRRPLLGKNSYPFCIVPQEKFLRV